MKDPYTLTFSGLTLYFMTARVFAEKIPFKQIIEPKQGWLFYFIAIIVLSAFACFFAKKIKQDLAKQSSCLVIDKKKLSAKTCLYLVEFQKQQFLIADNQQALALQALNKENSNGSL